MRSRTPQILETTSLSTVGAVMAKPASTIRLPCLCAARCVPFTIAAERDATVFKRMLVVTGRNKVRKKRNYGIVWCLGEG